MIFGDKKTFALDCALEKNPTEFFNCFFCFWVRGEQVGNYQRGTTLDHARSHYDDMLRGPSRRNDELAAKSDTEILNIVFEAIYDLRKADELTLEQLRQASKPYKRYDVSEQIPAFDGYLIVLVDGADKQHFAWRKWGTNGSTTDDEIILPLGTFETVVSEFVEWSYTIVPPGKLSYRYKAEQA